MHCLGKAAPKSLGGVAYTLDDFEAHLLEGGGEVGSVQCYGSVRADQNGMLFAGLVTACVRRTGKLDWSSPQTTTFNHKSRSISWLCLIWLI